MRVKVITINRIIKQLKIELCIFFIYPAWFTGYPITYPDVCLDLQTTGAGGSVPQGARGGEQPSGAAETSEQC